MASRDLIAAREAYENGDMERSRQAHSRLNSSSNNVQLQPSSSLSSSSSSTSPISSGGGSVPQTSAATNGVISPNAGVSSTVFSSGPNPVIQNASNSVLHSRSSATNQTSSLSSSSRLLPSSSSSSSFSSSSTTSSTNNNGNTTDPALPAAVCEPGHLSDTPSGKSFVAGALDGTATAAILLAACMVMDLDRSSSIRLLLSSGIGLCVAHAARDWMRFSQESTVWERERRREAWELENFPVGEAREMIELYMSMGVSEADATQVISTLVRYPTFFVDLMMAQELRMCPPDPTPFKTAIATARGFSLFYFFPLICLSLFMTSHGIENVSGLVSFTGNGGGGSSSSGSSGVISGVDMSSASSVLFSVLSQVPPVVVTFLVGVISCIAFAQSRAMNLPLHKGGVWWRQGLGVVVVSAVLTAGVAWLL